VPFCAFRAWLFRLTFDLEGCGHRVLHIPYRVSHSAGGPGLQAAIKSLCQSKAHLHAFHVAASAFISLTFSTPPPGWPPTHWNSNPTPAHHPLGGLGGRKRGLPINFFDCRRRNFYGFLLLFCIFMVF